MKIALASPGDPTMPPNSSAMLSMYYIVLYQLYAFCMPVYCSMLLCIMLYGAAAWVRERKEDQQDSNIPLSVQARTLLKLLH